MTKTCSASECEKQSRTRGLCPMHYARVLRGRPTGLRAKFGDYQRFAAKVALPDENGCMRWLGHRDKDGYGRFFLGGRMQTANRAALWFSAGSPPLQGRVMHAAHSCRNRDCVAPAHLRWATGKENAADRTTDGTQCVGEKHGQSRLKAEDVLAIKKLNDEGLASRSQIAERFGISTTTVGDIIRGDRWRHLMGDVG